MRQRAANRQRLPDSERETAGESPSPEQRADRPTARDVGDHPGSDKPVPEQNDCHEHLPAAPRATAQRVEVQRDHGHLERAIPAIPARGRKCGQSGDRHRHREHRVYTPPGNAAREHNQRHDRQRAERPMGLRGRVHKRPDRQQHREASIDQRQIDRS